MFNGVVDLFSKLVQNDFGFFGRIDSVADVMSPTVHRVSLDDTHKDVAAIFRDRDINHLAVVADDGEVVGIISDRDLLRHKPPFLGTAAEADEDQAVLSESTASFMSRKPHSIALSDSAATAVSLMIKHHIDALLVHDENNELCGIVTARDIVKLVLLFHQVCSQGPELERLRLVDLDVGTELPVDMIFSRCTRSARDVMCKKVRTLSKRDTLKAAIELIKRHGVRHVPIVDDANVVQGLVSDREILARLPSRIPLRARETMTDFREALFCIADTDEKVLRESLEVVMNSHPRVVTPESAFVSTIESFLTPSTSCVLAVDADKRVCGILTTFDVLRVFRNALEMALIQRTAQREPERIPADSV